MGLEFLFYIFAIPALLWELINFKYHFGINLTPIISEFVYAKIA